MMSSSIGMRSGIAPLPLMEVVIIVDIYLIGYYL